MNRRIRKTVYFELQERIPLNDTLSEIVAVHNVEIEPVIEMISEYASYRIKGHLNFIADYEGRRADKKAQPGREAKRYKVLDADPLEPFLIEREADHRKREQLVVEHRIPVDISLPADRVDENGIELEITALDYQLLQPRHLLVTATLALSGVLEEEPVYAGHEETAFFKGEREEVSFFSEDDEEIRIEQNQMWDRHMELQLAYDPYDHSVSLEDPAFLTEAKDAEGSAVQGSSAGKPAGSPPSKGEESGAESAVAVEAKGEDPQSYAGAEGAEERKANADGAKGHAGIEAKAEAKGQSGIEAKAEEKGPPGEAAKAETWEKPRAETSPNAVAKAAEETAGPGSERAEGAQQRTESKRGEEVEPRGTGGEKRAGTAPDAVKERRNIGEKPVTDSPGRTEEEVHAGLEGDAVEAAETETLVPSALQPEEESGARTEVKVSISNKPSLPVQAGEDGEEERLPEPENPDEDPRKSQTAQLLTQFLLNREEKMAQLRICLLQPGETLSEIARRYAVAESELLEANGLQDGSRPPGRVIKIPFRTAKSR